MNRCALIAINLFFFSYSASLRVNFLQDDTVVYGPVYKVTHGLYESFKNAQPTMWPTLDQIQELCEAEARYSAQKLGLDGFGKQSDEKLRNKVALVFLFLMKSQFR